MWISSHVEHHCLSQWHRKLWIWQKYGPHYLLLFEYWKVGLLWSFSMLSHLVKMLSTKWLSLNFKLAYFNIYLLKRFCTFLICIFFFLKKNNYFLHCSKQKQICFISMLLWILYFVFRVEYDHHSGKRKRGSIFFRKKKVILLNICNIERIM